MPDERPHNDSEIPPRKSTGVVKLEVERDVELAKIRAAENETWGELIARVLTAAKPLVEIAVPWCGRVVLGVCALGIVGLAVYLGRTLDLSALGLTASTGTATAAPAPPEAP